MSYIHENGGVRWKDKPLRTGPNAMSEAFKDAIADLNAEADAAGYTGAIGHFKYHHRKMALDNQAKVKKANKGKVKEPTGADRYLKDLADKIK